MIELESLSKMDILQMKWDILTELEKEKDSTKPTIPILNRLIPKDETTHKEEVDNSSNPKRTRNPRQSVILENGLELAKSKCKPYSHSPQYIGRGRVRIYNHICPLSISQLIDLKANLDKIPKKYNERLEWSKKRYGKPLHSIDRIIFNLYNGLYDNALKHYYERNHTINFNNDGSLKIGE